MRIPIPLAVRAALFLTIVVITLWWHRPTVAYAQTVVATGSECTGVDLILLIDQSTSMTGEDGQGGNDPADFRIKSVYSAIEQLGSNRMFFCPETEHRVVVISFGSVTEEHPAAIVDLEFTPITPNADDDQDRWANIREDLREQVQPQLLGGTDMASGFALAQTMFDDLPPAGPTPRRRAIVLLTDGNPCLPEQGCVDSNYTFRAGEYMQQMENDLATNMAYVEDQGVYIYVVAMQAQNDYMGIRYGRPINRTLREYWSDIAESHGGILQELANNESDIGIQFLQVVSDLSGVGDAQALECGDMYVDPYTERMGITVLKNLPGTGITIEQRALDGSSIEIKDGIVVPSEAVEIERHYPDPDDFYEQYIIHRPKPGLWRVSAENCDEVRFFRETQVPGISRIAPGAAQLDLYDGGDQAFDPVAPEFLIYQLQAKDGQPYVEDPAYRLALKATITSPSGNETVQDVLFKENSTYQGVSALPVDELGEYRVSLTGTTTSGNPEGGTITVFDRVLGTYRVGTEIKPFTFVVENPAINTVQPINEPGSNNTLPVTLQFRLIQDDTENPLNPHRVFDNANNAFTVNVEGPITLTDVPAEPDSADPSIYKVVLDQLNTEGDYVIDITMDGIYRSDRYNPGNTNIRVPIRRVAVSYFNLAITEPMSGTEQGLNRVGGGQNQLVPVAVTVQLVDEAGQPISPANVFVNAAQSELQATLIGVNGAEVGDTTLTPDAAGTGLYRGEIPGVDAEGNYQVIVTLPETIEPQIRYQPQNREQTVRFARVRTQPFDYAVEVPSTQAIHQGGVACVMGEQVAPTFAIQLLDENGAPLPNAEQVVIGGQEPIVARVVAPDTSTSDIPMQIVQTPNGPRLSGEASTIADVEGTYKFDVTLTNANVNPRFAPLQESKSISFERQDSWSTNPTVCRGIAGVLSLIVAGIVGFIAYSMMGGATGVINILASADPDGEVRAGPFSLTGSPREKRIQSNQLKNIGIKEIRVRKTEPPSPDVSKAIEVTVIDTEGAEMASAQIVEPDQPLYLTMDAVLYYR